MKRSLLTLLLLTASLSGFSTVYTITNTGTAFTQDTTYITVGDSVRFTLSPTIHSGREVSQTTWNANGNTALAGGFQTAGGGGLVLPAQLGVGTHWFVCPPHAAMGMKGVIIVQSANGIKENNTTLNLSFYPNPAKDIMNVKSSAALIGTAYSISDQLGKQVMTGKITNEATSLDISQLPAGIYFFQLADKRKQSFKLIKE